MSNIFEKIGHVFATGAKDTAKVLADTVEWLPRVESVLEDALKDEPEIKAAVLGLVKAGAGVVAEGTTAVASKGVNLVADAATVTDAESFFAYFESTFVPAVEAVYSEIKDDLEPTAAQTITASVPASESPAVVDASAGV